MKKQLPVATINPFFYRHQVSLCHLESKHAPKHITDVKVSAMSQETSKLKIDNSSKRFKMFSKHPSNGHYYISLTSIKVSKLICKLLGAVHD